MKRNITALAIAGAIGLAAIGSVGAASALSGTSSNDSLIDRLVEKFNLNKSDVQAVFDEEQQARTAERQAEVSDRLQSAVDDGDITAAQKTLIENKLKELAAARETQQAALETWAKENNIDLQYLNGRGRGNSDDRLQDAVDDGDISESQKKLIEDKQAELEDAQDKQRDELEQWTDDNEIDEKYLMNGMRGSHRKGF